jgi:hypothetical protein
MKLLLEQFLFLTTLLEYMGENIDMDEVGLTLEHFIKIDEEMDKIVGEYDVEKIKQEVLELVQMITEGK